MANNYNPTEVSLTVGPYLIEFDELTVERDEEKYMYSTGTYGQTTRIKNANNLTTLTVTLPQGSSNNDNLSTLFQAGDPVPIAIIDNNGTTKVFIPLGTVSNFPSITFGKESGQREWIIKGDMPDTAWAGGHNDLGA